MVRVGLNLQGDDRCALPEYRGRVKSHGSPSPSPLERARLSQHVLMRSLRALAMALLVLIVVTTLVTKPRPGLSGDRLGVLLGLVAVALGVVGVLRSVPRATVVKVFFLAVLMAGSMTLVWFQPSGSGYVGVDLAVALAALLLRRQAGFAVVAVAVVAEALVGVLAGGRTAGSIALTEVGVIAFYLIALLARQLQEGQDQAQRLLLELEQSREALAEAAALAERQRLAREMHDVLAHSLSGLVLQLEGARLLAARRQEDHELADTVERAHRLAKAGLEEARRAIGLLRDDALPGPDRLEALAKNFAADTGTRCTLEVSGEARSLSSEARLTLYRVAQEALTNVRRHATPSRVELHLSYEAAGTRLTIEDFGENGHVVLSPAGEGYGLTGMRERAELLGGELTATKTSLGFRVELWVPR